MLVPVALWAACLLLPGCGNATAPDAGPDYDSGPVALHVGDATPLSYYGAPMLLLALTAPLLVRRRYPVAVFSVVALSAFIQWLTIPNIGPYDLAVLVALYSTAVYTTRRLSLPALTVALRCSSWSRTRSPYATRAPPGQRRSRDWEC